MIKGITANEEVIIKQLLAPYTPEYAFYFYGSRVKGGYTKVSDLDILIKGDKTMPLDTLDQIKQQFDESPLPYIVNFSDFHKLDESFYNRIKDDLNAVF